ncbi:MAG: molybdopterin molybdenumtransferase MoeA [Chloroflexi bacterium]|nr:molybdopterin molybdenumtransferase MoeA [Chloroflexota bacterium]
MPEFLRLQTPSEALSRLLEALPAEARLGSEDLPTAEALGRILAVDIRAPHALPPFPRSSVDGYAVRAADTFGASASLPAYLSVAGEVLMGTLTTLSLDRGQAALVHTGGMIPAGADAVVMVEDTQVARPDEIEVLKPAAPGQNVLQLGEDVQPGEIVLQRGARLRAQELGGLMALGFTRVEVVRRPRVAILSTGDEVVAPEADPLPGQVRDVNTTTLSALVELGGGEPVFYGILPDRREALEAAARRAHAECDVVLITAGSSVSTRDITSEIIATLGAPGVLAHGVALRPGKPTILAVCSGKPVIGLPGNPVSALVVAGLFVTPLLRRLLGVQAPRLIPRVTARLVTNIPSESGREDYVPVRVTGTEGDYTAEPVFGKSNLIFTLVRADGLVRVPAEANGLPAGIIVEVLLF